MHLIHIYARLSVCECMCVRVYVHNKQNELRKSDNRHEIVKIPRGQLYG